MLDNHILDNRALETITLHINTHRDHISGKQGTSIKPNA